MYRQVLLKLAQMGLLAALGACGQGCMELTYECSSSADCPAGLECVAHFPNRSSTHTSSYCMLARFTEDLRDPTDSSKFDIGGQDVGGEPGVDPGADLGVDLGQDPGVEDAATDPEVDPGIDPGADPGNDTGNEPGTWFDSSSGLTWENPPYWGVKTWDDAKSYCAVLSLAGGGWRLPTISELRSLIRGCVATGLGGSCGVTDSCLFWDGCRDSSCDGCPYSVGPAGGCFRQYGVVGSCSSYWSSSPVVDYLGGAFIVGFDDGGVAGRHTVDESNVRCVRSEYPVP